MDCTICNETKEDAANIELLCGHTFHTECWLRRSGAVATLGGLRCASCNEYIIPDEMNVEFGGVVAPDNTGTEIVKLMWAENPDFKNFLIESVKKWKNHKKSSALLKKKANELLKDEELLEYRQILKTKLSDLRTELMKSTEYKEAMRNQRINNIASGNLNTRWGITGWDVRSALKDEPEVKVIISARSWTHRLARIINKFKYYRIR